MTKDQKSALLWLKNRNGDGVFDKHQVLTAAGERAPIMRSTWNRLEAQGMVQFYANRRRVRLTEPGQAYDLSHVQESRRY